MKERRTVLVTGGMRRLGAAIANRLEEQDWCVIRHSRKGGDVQADLSNHNAVDNLFIESLRCYGHIDAIVNNAALFSCENESYLRHVNYSAPLELMRYFDAYLRQTNRRGCVVNVLDICVEHLPRDSYEQSKYDLAIQTQESVKRYAPFMRVNAVAPGDILPPEALHIKARARLLHYQPKPEDLADAVAYLLNAEAVTGQLIAVDSGARLIESVP